MWRGPLPHETLGRTTSKKLIDEVSKISHKQFGEEKDLIGHVYEYFLREFAVNAKKERGEFYILCFSRMHKNYDVINEPKIQY